jgi:hypothetical protein
MGHYSNRVSLAGLAAGFGHCRFFGSATAPAERAQAFESKSPFAKA